MFPTSATWVAVPVTLVMTDARPENVRAAVERALPLLMKAAQGHIEQRSCFACHNQTFPLLAAVTAHSRGFTADAEAINRQIEHVAEFLDVNRERYLKGQGTGGQVDTAGYALMTLELGGHAPDENTAAVVEYLLQFPGKRDYWRVVSNRPPSEASDFTTTYLALRGLRVWGTEEHQDRIQKLREAARQWLLRTSAKDTEDRVFRLLALKEVEADQEAIRAAASELLKTQQYDGGWGQLDGMVSDAYATGSALVALHEAGGMATNAAEYRRGVGFLLGNQQVDGSWYVKSRSKPFQTYFETGFPHGNDQFISVAASGWATTALVLTLPCEE
jgi:hypothetical protein